MQHTTHAERSRDDLRARIARLERSSKAVKPGRVMPFDGGVIDAHLPGNGLLLSALHEFTGTGSDTETASASTLLLAGLLARVPGQVLWVTDRQDVCPAALANAGLHPDRVVFAHARKAVLLVMEEGLRHRGLAGVVGELWGRLGLTASRRLQLAAEASGVTAFVLRRSHRFVASPLARTADANPLAPAADASPLARTADASPLAQPAEPSAAMTRWRVAALPSPPALPYAPRVAGIGRGRWQIDLVRCRGGVPASWIMEAGDAPGHFRLVADLADRPATARLTG